MKPTEESEDARRVRAQLRAAAHAHQPDRARMAARIACAAEEPGGSREGRGPRLPVAGTVGALLVVLGVGGTAALWARIGDGSGGGPGHPPTVRSSAGPAAGGAGGAGARARAVRSPRTALWTGGATPTGRRRR
ncbi:hypothetical protein [Streptomyces axinellae]|uniref:Uncharacterized protein n=1 Tax=Streptomyces axinellae TaxID=552788 RepID=A0ABN3QET9_9ACTN